MRFNNASPPTPRQAEADVLVIGAGPAGCAAAIVCARKGLRVILLEAARFPRFRAGETLHPGLDVLWNSLGLSEAISRADFLRSDGHYIDCKGTVTFAAYGSDAGGPWLGYHAWRADLDTILLNAARDAGTDVWQSCAARNVIINNGRVTGALSDRGIVHSRFLLDGSGSVQWLQRQLSLPLRTFSDKLVARYGYLGVTEMATSRPTFYMRDEGWYWHAQVRRDLTAWVQVTHRNNDDVGEMNNPLLCVTRLSPCRRANVTWRLVPQNAGPGYFILGDAAAVLDPASSHGVLRAIASGIMAGHQVLALYARMANESISTEAYKHWLISWFERDVDRLRGMYKERCPGLFMSIFQ